VIVESGAGLDCAPDNSFALAVLLDMSGIKERLLKLDLIKRQLNAQGYDSG
jgi:hypothetical protein